MRTLDALGYGNLLSLDGFRGDPAALASEAEVSELLRELGELLDPAGTPEVTIEAGDDGMSGAMVSSESQLTVHTFPDLERITFRAFSRRILPVITLGERVRVRFRVGRLETQLRHRATLVPHEPGALVRALRGERTYARLRLDDILRG